MLILPETDSLITMASSIEPTSVPKTLDSMNNEVYTTDVIKSPPPHPSILEQKHSPGHNQCLTPMLQQRRQQQQKEYRQHAQQPRQPHHNWDINDSTLPVPDMYDPFDIWPVGHCRRVYHGDVDDARRHISGWAMRNTNNHNALILKKSCLGVLICSNDCMLDNGRKVHFRPAICDKARRKQIGKPCPNPGCCGKLTLLPCRGHCGYPVTHFWRQMKGSVFFQAKGYHDHPRPDVKSLSEKGRNALAKHIRHNMNPLVLRPSKRRHTSISRESSSAKKMSLKEKEVMCSCPPFECSCKPNQTPQNNMSFPKLQPPNSCPSFNTVLQHTGPFPQESFQTGPVTQINITNACLPPHPPPPPPPHHNMGANIPYSSSPFLPPNTRICHTNNFIGEDPNQYPRYGSCDLSPPPYFYTELPQTVNHDQMLLEHPMSYTGYHGTTEHPSVICEKSQAQSTHTQFENQRDTNLNVSPGSTHHVKSEHSEPNFLMPCSIPQSDLRQPAEPREHSSVIQQNPAFMHDFNAFNYGPPPESHILQPREYEEPSENKSDYKSLQSRQHLELLDRENQGHHDNMPSYDQSHDPNMHQQPTFITLTPLPCRSNERSAISIPTTVENLNCPSTEHGFCYNENTRISSMTPPNLIKSNMTTEAELTHLGHNLHSGNEVLPPHHFGSEMNHPQEVSVVNLPGSTSLSRPPSHHNLPTTPGQHIMPNDTAAASYYHNLNYPNTPTNTNYNPYYSDVFQPTSTHTQQYQHTQQHQQQPQQRGNSINITLTYN